MLTLALRIVVDDKIDLWFGVSAFLIHCDSLVRELGVECVGGCGGEA